MMVKDFEDRKDLGFSPTESNGVMYQEYAAPHRTGAPITREPYGPAGTLSVEPQ
jgi:hypothetical protein